MDPERRRQLMALAELNREWASRNQVDDAEWVPDGSDGAGRRPPSAEAEWEYMTRAREIMGLDPQTGLYLDNRPPVLPAARTPDEAHVYMDLHSCQRCASVETPWQGALADRDGTMIRRYFGACGTCGLDREFLFALPEHPVLPPTGSVVYFGGPEPSRLLDPGEWMAVADLCARAASLPQGSAPTDESRYDLAVAIAAVEEVLKFIPAGADEVPESAFTSVNGHGAYTREPGRFRRRRLLIVRDSYAGAL
jgi:hypothetical protein